MGEWNLQVKKEAVQSAKRVLKSYKFDGQYKLKDINSSVKFQI